MAQPMEHQANKRAIEQTSPLQGLWESGGFALTVQFPLCLTAKAEDFVAQVVAWASLFDAVLVADAPNGAVALSSLAMAILLKRANIETIVQFSGRDRNRLALQGDILSLGALGMPNLLVDMRPVVRASLIRNIDARLVTDLDGPALLATAVRLRDDARFISGTTIKTPPALYVGAFAALEALIQTEVLSSAQFIVTMPVYDTQGFIAALDAFEVAHPDFLQRRPLLVSLPLIPDTVVDSKTALAEPQEADIQKIATSIDLLKRHNGVRGLNIVVSEQTDLALLEQIVRRANADSVERG